MAGVWSPYVCDEEACPVEPSVPSRTEGGTAQDCWMHHRFVRQSELLGACRPVSENLRPEMHFEGRSMRCYPRRPSSLWRGFELAAVAMPEAPALTDGTVTLNYAELRGRACRLAAGLLARGLTLGDRVVLNLGNCAEYDIAFLACQRPVPVGHRLAAPELEYIYGTVRARSS